MRKYNNFGELPPLILYICYRLDYFKNEYKNPRNFAAGSIRLLDSKECASRQLMFVAWDCITGNPADVTLDAKLDRLYDFGFDTVP